MTDRHERPVRWAVSQRWWWESTFSLVTAMLAGLWAAAAEVGAVLIVAQH